jgi:resuscitation-promoting factor RpfB
MTTPELTPPAPLPHLRPIIVVLVLVLLAAAVALLAASLLRPQVTVTLVIDSAAQTLTLRANTVGEALEDAGIRLGAADRVLPGLDAAVSDGDTIRITRAQDVQLIVDGTARTVSTSLDTPGAILEAFDVDVSAVDQVRVNDEPVPADRLGTWAGVVREISVRHAIPFVLEETLASGQVVSRALRSSAETLGQALFDLDMTIYLADELDPAPETPLTPDLLVMLRRAMQVTILVEGERLDVRIQGGSVRDALASAGVALMALDYTRPALDVPLSPGALIEVVRVHETLTTRLESIPFETVYVQRTSADERNTDGTPGILQVIIRNRAENGVAVSRQEISRTTLETPAPEVIYVDAED